MQSQLAQYEIVLLGVGHTNAHVLRMWRMNPLADTRLTCVSNFGVATYSGMLPGVLSGQYAAERMEIDLVRLCAAANARLIIGEVDGLDLDRRQLLLSERPPLDYDALSIGVGSLPQMEGVQGDGDPPLAIKPMQTFLERFDARLRSIRERVAGENRQRQIYVTIVGAGVGGVEIAFCLSPRMKQVLGQHPFTVNLVTSSEHVAGGTLAKTQLLAKRNLEDRGVRVHCGRRVERVSQGSVGCDNGCEIPSDIVILATGATAPSWLNRLGLTTDDRGFLLTRPTLQTVTSDHVFAVGDTGTIADVDVPKAGVYAVRQGPVLWRNLGKLMANRPLEPYRPQRSFLKLMNMGDGTALGEYFGQTFQGGWVWRLKDRIDSRFMDKYQDYQLSMSSGPSLTEDAEEMRCAGCGGKVGAGTLSQVLSDLSFTGGPEVIQGLDAPDDAAVLQPPSGESLVVTNDFFAPPMDEPYTVGRIAALNAASDVYAMGARPWAALAQVTIPAGHPRAQSRIFHDLMSGAKREFDEMAVSVVGGHTLEGPRTTIGFTVLGSSPPESIQRSTDVNVGDQLVLTKPLGSGVLLAGHMRAMCHARWMEGLLEVMLTSNARAAQLATELGASTMTDVTGFGLVGHLLEMLGPDAFAADLWWNEIPVLDGTTVMFEAGIESTLAPDNRMAEASIKTPEAVRKDPRYGILFDPQTSGGLLISVTVDKVKELVQRLSQEQGIEVRVVGQVKPHQVGGPSVHVV